MDDSIDWDFWRHKTEVHLWQAAFLSCNIDPDSESYRDINHYGIDNAKVNKRLRLLKDNLILRQFFSSGTSLSTDSNLKGVRLPEFATWCAYVGFEIPPELAALAKAAPQAAPKLEPVPVVTPVQATQNKLRRNSLDPAIDEAIKQAASKELAAVYLKLKAMALDEVMPFTGALEGDALCYTDDESKPAKLSKDALGKRLKRR